MKKLSKRKISKLLFISTAVCFGLYDVSLLQSCGGGNKNSNLYNTVTGVSIAQLYPSSANGKLNDPSMIYVEGGAFLCGRYRDKNSHIVTVTPFMISKAEITNREYNEFVRWCMDNDPNAVKDILPNFDTDIKSLKLARFNDQYFKDYFYNVAFQNYPVINVSWVQANKYCEWRSDRGNEKVNPNWIPKRSTYAINLPTVPGVNAQPQNPMMGGQMGMNPMMQNPYGLQQNPMMGGQMGMNPMMQQPMMPSQMGVPQNPMMGGQMGMNPMMQQQMMPNQMGIQQGPMMMGGNPMGIGQFMSEQKVENQNDESNIFQRVMMPQNPMMMGGQMGMNPMMQQPMMPNQMGMQQNPYGMQPNPMMRGQMGMNPMMQQPMIPSQMGMQQNPYGMSGMGNQMNNGETKRDLDDDVVNFRLPTEIEWEFVASGAHGEMFDGVPVCKQGIYPWGDGIKVRGEYGEWNNKVLANFYYQPGIYNGVPGETNKINLNTDVFAFPPNVLGVFDLGGNVAEWVADVYRNLGAQEYADFNPYRKNGEMDAAKNYIETGISDDMHVYKGASWNDPIYFCQVGTRRFMHKDDSSPEVGFRVVMNVAFDANELKTAKTVVSNEKKNKKVQPKANNQQNPMMGGQMGMNPMMQQQMGMQQNPMMGGQMGMNPMMQQQMMPNQMGMQQNPMMMPQQRW